MTCLDANLTIVDREPIDIFEESKSIIYCFLNNQFKSLNYMKEDVVEECFVAFWQYCVNSYDYKRGVTIWKYLKNTYRNVMLKIVLCEKKHQSVSIADNEIMSIQNLDENVIYSILNEEQKTILELVMAGYKYSEIFDMLELPNKTSDKKRPIYRRMVKIKTKIAKAYGIRYKKPNIK